MPSDEEKVFFIRAFRLIDDQSGTKWLPIYCTLESESPNGRINWGRLQGLLTTPYRGTGYKKAVNRVVEILEDYIFIEDTERNPDQKLRQQFRELALLARAIYTLRQTALNFHGRTDLESGGDAGHIAACSVWKEASDALGTALSLFTEIQPHHPRPTVPRAIIQPEVFSYPHRPQMIQPRTIDQGDLPAGMVPVIQSEVFSYPHRPHSEPYFSHQMDVQIPQHQPPNPSNLGQPVRLNTNQLQANTAKGTIMVVVALAACVAVGLTLWAMIHG